MAIYLLHFTRRINPSRPAQHYLGYADDIAQRLAEHAAGRGARLTQVALERGIPWALVRTWEGPGADRTRERRMKRWKHADRLCPLCGSRGRCRKGGGAPAGAIAAGTWTPDEGKSSGVLVAPTT